MKDDMLGGAGFEYVPESLAGNVEWFATEGYQEPPGGKPDTLVTKVIAGDPTGRRLALRSPRTGPSAIRGEAWA